MESYMANFHISVKVTGYRAWNCLLCIPDGDIWYS